MIMSNNNSVNTVIIVPCYNEEKRWNHAYWERFRELPNTHLIFIDDGSTDDTMQCIAQTITHLRNPEGSLGSVLRLAENEGKANAVRLGILEVLRKNPEVERIGFLDSDAAFDFQDISRVMSLEIREPFNAIWSSRVKLSGRAISRDNRRHWISRVIATGLGVISSELPYDTQSGFKIFDNEPFLRNALVYPFKTKWFFELELISRCKSLKIWEEPLNYWHDVPGSKLSLKSTGSIVRELIIVFGLLHKNKRQIS